MNSTQPTPLQFTSDQLEDFQKYVKVQKSNRYNMFDPRARVATGLTEERYLFVMDNYDALATRTAGKQLEERYPWGYRSEDNAP